MRAGRILVFELRGRVFKHDLLKIAILNQRKDHWSNTRDTVEQMQAAVVKRCCCLVQSHSYLQSPSCHAPKGARVRLCVRALACACVCAHISLKMFESLSI